MTVQDIVTLISGVGFPIVMCGVLCFFINKRTERYLTSIEDITAAITELSNKIK